MDDVAGADDLGSGAGGGQAFDDAFDAAVGDTGDRAGGAEAEASITHGTGVAGQAGLGHDDRAVVGDGQTAGAIEPPGDLLDRRGSSDRRDAAAISGPRVSLPASSGMTSATARAAPVVVGIIEKAAARARRSASWVVRHRTNRANRKLPVRGQ